MVGHNGLIRAIKLSHYPNQIPESSINSSLADGAYLTSGARKIFNSRTFTKCGVEDSIESSDHDHYVIIQGTAATGLGLLLFTPGVKLIETQEDYAQSARGNREETLSMRR